MIETTQLFDQNGQRIGQFSVIKVREAEGEFKVVEAEIQIRLADKLGSRV